MSAVNVPRMAKKNPAVALASDRGWEIRYSRGGHLLRDCPYGCCRVVATTSPSDWRGEKNAVSIIKKCPQRTTKGA